MNVRDDEVLEVLERRVDGCDHDDYDAQLRKMIAHRARRVVRLVGNGAYRVARYSECAP